ncbi:hypothetical protein Pelo_17739 [Pelomyxa schiedti]|nr:hypothetical protein Pelo_17739 [Pelomyxa schiedti]
MWTEAAQHEPSRIEKFIPGTLSPPRHVIRAREQIVALFTCLVPHCGRRSPASVLPAPIIADEIGAKWVVHVDRWIVLSGDGLFVPPLGSSTVSSDLRILDFVFVGVSPTLGVVDIHAYRRSRFVSDEIHLKPEGMIGGRLAVALIDGKIAVANMVTHEVIDVADDPGLMGMWSFNVSKGRKWVVIWEHVQSIVVMPAVNAGRPMGKTVDVGKRTAWVDMISDGEAAVMTMEDGGGHMLDMWCVDLKGSFESGHVVVTGRFNGFDTVGRVNFFHSKEHTVIMSFPHVDGHTQWKSPFPNLRVLHHSLFQHEIFKVDDTHFAGEDRANNTLSVFSTDDFHHPIRTLPLHGNFLCGNGFIVFWHESSFDIVDGASGPMKEL